MAIPGMPSVTFVVPRAGVWIETIYYESIRNSKKDLIVNSFQRIVDFPRYTYRKCRNVFINERELYGGAKRFESDYGMSSSFRRLCKGKLIQEQAIILLRHEHLKYGLMNKIDMLYDEAYELAQRKYNYKTALEKFKKKNGL